VGDRNHFVTETETANNKDVVNNNMAPMKRKLTNDPLEFFRTLPSGIALKIYRFTIHVFDSRQQLIEAVDLYVETRYGNPRGRRSSRWGPHRPIGEWDVSRVTDLSHVFSNFRNRSMRDFNEDLSLWDVSNGTNFAQMFYRCCYFNGDLSKWNVSKAANFANMFSGCHLFNADVSDWNVSNATSLNSMFYSCGSFNAVYLS
jgi:surface protein